MTPPPMAVALTVVKGPERGRAMEFREPRGFLIGRATDADLRLPQDDPYVSRRHVYLEICPPTCRLRDIGGTNPAKVNGEDFIERELRDGDVIEVGYTQLKVSIQAPGIAEIHRCGGCGGAIELVAGEPVPDRCAACVEAEARRRTRPAPAAHRVACARCSADLTECANSDGRAMELQDIAVYLCEACCDECLPRANDGDSAVGAYEILGRLGEGGMGIVSLAYHRPTARVFVLKRIKDVKDKLLARRFAREVRFLRGLAHPNIVRYVDTGIDESGMPYLVTEYVTDGSLQDMLAASGGWLRPEDAVSMVCQVLDGLAYIHAQSIIHRDIKPQNILVRRHPAPGGPAGHIAKLMDFGLAVSYARAGGTRLTKPGTGLGTLMFMPPEQIQDAGTVREPADTYAAGVTLYYLLTGQYPYNFPAPAEIQAFQQQNRKLWDRPEEAIRALMQLRRIMHPFHIILDETPIPIRQRDPSIPEPLAAVVDRSVRKEIGDRFQAAVDFRRALQMVL
jgi:serine/threonine protein kinase